MAKSEKSLILLISINQCDEPYPVFPLGLAYVDAALRRAGYQTRLIDWQMDRTVMARNACGICTRLCRHFIAQH